MNTIDIDFFFASLKAGLWERDIDFSSFDQVDYNEIYQLAREQTVEGLVAAGFDYIRDANAPKEEFLCFVGSVLQIEQQNKAMNQFVADMVNKMRSVGIYTVLVKGQGVAQCYKRPLWRMCGDVDFFFSNEDYQKAKEFLLPMSSSTEKYTQGNHFEMVIDSWVVELHGWFHGGISNRINKVLDDVHNDTFLGANVRIWNNNGVQVSLLSPENDAFYVFVHFVNHFYKGGIGLRQICDWCRLLWTYKNEMDIRKLESRITSAKLMTEWRAFGAFAVDYLGLPVDVIPFYSGNDKWKKKAKLICSFIMESGNFGHKRDTSYYHKYPYLISKCYSLTIRIIDLCHHARIFPMDSLRFFPYIIYSGINSAVRGA